MESDALQVYFSFLKQDEVVPAFESLEEKLEGVVPDSFISYFEKNYIGMPYGRKKIPKVPKLLERR